MYINESRALTETLALQCNIAVMLWGPPGIGKSSLVHDIANDYTLKATDPELMKKFPQIAKMYPDGLGLVDLRCAQLDPTDLRGVPMPDKEANVSKWYPPSFFPQNNDKWPRHGIIFLDELEKAPTSVKNAALQLVLDRRVGDYVVPEGWSIISAGNREEDGTFSQPLGAALENRMAHIEVELNVDQWLAWAREHEVIDDVIGYITSREDHLYVTKEDQDGNKVRGIASRAFPSPRTWHMASRGMSVAKSRKLQYQILASCIGREVTTDFINWHQIFKNVNPVDIIENGNIPSDLGNKEMSFQYAVALACVFHVNKIDMLKMPHARRYTAKFLELIPNELSVVFWRNLKPKLAVPMAKDPIFDGIVSEIMSAVDDE